MDVTFKTPEGRFNYRVCAILLHNGKLLAMHDEVSPYYYLPGGRVLLHETAEEAIVRELREELDIKAAIVRPLWLCQSFFTEDVKQERFHELCLYFLMDASHTGLFDRGERFILHEGSKHTLRFEWLPLERLKDEYLYPNFIKESVFHLPNHLTLIQDYN